MFNLITGIIGAIRYIAGERTDDNRNDYTWFLSDEYPKYAYSYCGGCNILKIDYEKIRDRILNKAPIERAKGIAVSAIVLDLSQASTELKKDNWSRKNGKRNRRSVITE